MKISDPRIQPSIPQAWSIWQTTHRSVSSAGSKNYHPVVKNLIDQQIRACPGFGGGNFTALELGSGDSWLSADLATDFPQGEFHTLEGNETVPPGAAEGRITHHRGLIENLPFSEARYNLVFGIHSVCYLDPAVSGPILANVLKPGGRALLALMHPESGWLQNIDSYRLLQEFLFLDREEKLKHPNAQRNLSAFLLERGNDLAGYSKNAKTYGDIYFSSRYFLRMNGAPDKILQAIDELQMAIDLDYDRSRLFKNKHEIMDYARRAGLIFRECSVILPNRHWLERWLYAIFPQLDTSFFKSWWVVLEKPAS